MGATRERNWGIDLLRIVSMLMVVVLHVLGQGGVLKSSEPLSTSWSIAWLLEIMAYCAVNCYALISGYVGVNSKMKYSNIAYMWLQVAFYTVLISAVFAYLTPEVTKMDVLKAFFPVSKSYYWYFTAYFAIFFLTPVFNKALNALTTKQMYALGIAIIILFSLIPSHKKTDPFYENNGYSALWLMMLYILGGIINKCEIIKKVRGYVAVIGYFAVIGITWAQKYFIERHNMIVPDDKMKVTLVSYVSPTILLAGVFLLIAFSKIKVAKIPQKLISFFAPLSFSVYLIHVHKYIWKYVMKDRFVQYAEFGVFKMVVYVLLSALAIYLICSLIDFVRDRLFKLFRVRELLVKIENKIFKNLWAQDKETPSKAEN